MGEEPTRPHNNGPANLSDVAAELRTVNARLQHLEDKFGARSRETQPLPERINRIFSEVAAVRHEQAAVRHELREVSRTLRRMNVARATALRKQGDLADRVSNLEAQQPQQR